MFKAKAYTQASCIVRDLQAFYLQPAVYCGTVKLYFELTLLTSLLRNIRVFWLVVSLKYKQHGSFNSNKHQILGGVLSNIILLLGLFLWFLNLDAILPGLISYKRTFDGTKGRGEFFL